ncbi:copper resistance D family protein [Undibacterium sp. RuTC16W]|uniref:copper resistance D family protein n=1 Tax=Undibacterium sp. RuTC16W TaxID=3413048 RepID=UPI003BF37991
MDSPLLHLFASIDGWQICTILIKVMTYATCLTVSGGVFFLMIFAAYLDAAEVKTMKRFTSVMALIAAALSIARIFMMSGMLSDDLRGMWDVQFLKMVLGSKEGLALSLRLPSLFLLAIWTYAGERKIHPAVPLLSAILISVSFSTVGHVHELDGATRLVAQLLVTLHLLAVSFWVGALWPLFHITYDHHTFKVAAITHQFGKLAVIIVGTLLLAGISLLCLLQGFSAKAWQAEYGQLILLKLISVSVLLGLAARNKFQLTPQLRRGERSAITQLRRSIVMEIIVAGIILLITASFTTITGPTTLA